MEIVLSENTRAGNKYAARVGSTTFHFNASGYEDFTMHRDSKRNARYLARHNNESWSDPATAGCWSRWLLWNKPLIADFVQDLKNRGFKVLVKFQSV